MSRRFKHWSFDPPDTSVEEHTWEEVDAMSDRKVLAELADRGREASLTYNTIEELRQQLYEILVEENLYGES